MTINYTPDKKQIEITIRKDSALEIYCLNQKKSVKFDKKDLPEKLEGKFLGYARDPETNKLLTAYVIKPIPSENWKLILTGKRGYEKSIAVLDKLCQFIFEDEKEIYYARCVKKTDMSQIGKLATNFLKYNFWIASRAKGKSKKQNGFDLYIMNNRNFVEGYTTLLNGNTVSSKYRGICPIVFIKSNISFWMNPMITLVNKNSQELKDEIDYRKIVKH